MSRPRVLPLVALAFAVALATGAGAAAQTAAPPPKPLPSWSWPPIPGCLADPEIKTSGTTDYDSPLCAVYERLLEGGATEIELESARRLNGELDGVLYPAFLPGTEVVRFVTDRFDREFHGPSGLVRVSTSAVTARSGSWWTALATVSDGTRLLGAEAIRAKLALTGTPSCLAYASLVRDGVRGYMGVVAPAFDEPGGGLEFWFPPGAVVAGPVADLPGTSGCGGS
ncbi:MAG: hypothetical protein WAJ85_07725 [Candidatus Baltobacteraceae bacterium]|jgi:hypothetical protein